MNVSSFFQGSLLKFSLAGEGVTIDPKTGELIVATEALAKGITVDVVTEDAAGAAGASFRLTIAAQPSATEDVAPSLLTPPTIAGSGRIGAALTVTPGAWGGVPAPAIALQWLRDGAAVSGATGDSYVPVAADDGREITCRVTASNAAGELVAEPAAVRVTLAPPVAVGALADVDVSEGSEAVAVEAAAAFAGEALSFAVAGAGAAIDPGTGVLILATDVVREAETVTVTATNSGGSAEVAFLATVRAKMLPVAPVLLAAPVLAGTGKIGSEVTVDSGSWSGLPLPVLSLQWLRDGTEIVGATGAAYVPGPEDDRCALSCRISAVNTAGSLSSETAALAITHVAPTLVGELFDEIFDQGIGDEVVETAAAFAGEALRFAATGAGVAIDPETGVLTVSTDAALSGERITVSATNSGGSAEGAFLLTVEAAAITGFPAPITDTAWTVREVRDVAPAGRRRVEISPGAGVEGFELCWYSGPADGRENTDWRRAMQPGESYTTNSSMKVGSACYNLLFWRRVEDGAWEVASNEVVFDITGLEALPPPPDPMGQFPAANQTLMTASAAALTSALERPHRQRHHRHVDHRSADGDYGNLSLNDYRLPGKTILRSANRATTGAKFRSFSMQRAKNIEFQFVNLDRVGQGFRQYPIDLSGAEKCGFRYCDIDFGENVRNNLKPMAASRTPPGASASGSMTPPRPAQATSPST